MKIPVSSQVSINLQGETVAYVATRFAQATTFNQDMDEADSHAKARCAVEHFGRVMSDLFYGKILHKLSQLEELACQFQFPHADDAKRLHDILQLTSEISQLCRIEPEDAEEPPQP